MKAEYVDHMGSDLSVVNAARVSFDKQSTWEWSHAQGEVPEKVLRQSDEKLIQYLSKNGHWTPFSHTAVTLRMTAPVPIRTQCFKHKQGFTENEVSRRYVNDPPSFFMPDDWRGRPVSSKQGSDGVLTEETQALLNREYSTLLETALSVYEAMIDGGVAPEQARFVLPQAMYTSWYWTGSLAAYARFYKLRVDPHAQKEIQDLAEMVGDVVAPLYPVSWKALTST